MNKKDLKRNFFMLDGRFARQGYDWWWHNFTAINEKTGEEKPFFIEYFTCNPSLLDQTEDDLPVLGQAPLSKVNKLRPSYLMVKCGFWGEEKAQLHRFIPWKDVVIENDSKAGFSVSAQDCYCSETVLKGKVNVSSADADSHPEYMCDAGSMEWMLTVEKDVAFNVGYGASGLFRKLKAFQMYWHAQGMKSKFSGTIICNGERYIVKPESSFGYSDKNWGSDFTSPWVWLSSNDLYSNIHHKKLEDSVFDIGGGRPVVFGLALNRKLLSDFWYEGKSYEFNFSKFWTFCRTKFDCQETISAIMETEITCDKSKMLLVNYEAPNGTKKHNRLWNGGHGQGTVRLYKKRLFSKPLLVDDIKVGHTGCEWGEYC